MLQRLIKREEIVAKIKDLIPNRLNPRTMSGEKLQALKHSMEIFGDLGGIVVNVRTKTIVSAHQRSSVMDENSKIMIKQQFNPPTPTGTTAIGYVECDGEFYSYREVDWDETKQTEALLAANKHSGEWDKENLRILFADHPFINLELTGFEIAELEMMEIPFSMDSIQSPHIDNILGYEEEVDDKTYLKNESKSQMEIDRERFPSDTKYEKKPDPVVPPVKEIDPLEHEADKILSPFDKVEEKTTVDGKRIVLIIDCDTEEIKQALKLKLKPLVEEAKARFF